MIRGYFRRPSPHAALLGSGLFLLGSFLLLALHARAVRDMSESGLGAAIAIPTLEQRITLLQEQADLMAVQAMLKGGGEKDVFRLYVLPDGDEIDHLLVLLDTVIEAFREEGTMRAVSAIEVGAATEEGLPAGIRAIPFSFEAVMTEQGWKDLLTLFDLTGILTVSDALTPGDIEKLLTFTEAENPAAISALEHFLGTDARSYIEEPKPVLEQLRRSFSEQTFEGSMLPLLAASRLASAERLLRPLLPALTNARAWPLRFLQVTHVVHTTEGSLVRLQITGRAFSRGDLETENE